VQTAGAPNVDALFQVTNVSRSMRRVIPRRIPAVRPIKGLTNQQINFMKCAAYEHAHLEEYKPCWTGEMAMRPIPFVSTDPKPKRTQAVFSRYIHDVLAFLVPEITPGIQTINKISSLGYPINANPGSGVDPTSGEQVFESKFDVVLNLFQSMQDGDFSLYEDGYHTVGVRKQNEPPSSKRVFQFIGDKGIYEKQITAADRAISVPQLGVMIGSRTRLIVRPPVVNLYLQCWDTLLHNAIKRHELCEANVYARTQWPDDTHWRTFDCKHYERYLGLCAISYAAAIGGAYETELLKLIDYPFIVPDDKWSKVYEIRPRYSETTYPQFSSGLSPVAPLGKLTNICCQVAYFHEEQKQDIHTAIATTLSGISEGMRRWSFGDDNRLTGRKDAIDAFCKFMEQYFDIEYDDTPTYLGTIYRPDLRRWVLPARTYNLKLYQPERDFDWKDYPSLGLFERRETFIRYGEPEIGGDIIPFENSLWDAVGHPFVEVAAAAVAERQRAMKKGIELTKLLVTDKSYLMTETEKAASGLFWHLSADVTATIVLKLVGERIRGMLRFRDMPYMPIPKGKTNRVPYSDSLGTKQDENEEEDTA